MFGLFNKKKAMQPRKAQSMNDTTKYLLGEEDIPKVWYNIAADLPSPPPPPLHPGTGQPVGPDDLAPLFPMALIMQEVSAEREIEIPEPVREIYKLWRPSPLVRAAAVSDLPPEPEEVLSDPAAAAWTRAPAALSDYADYDGGEDELRGRDGPLKVGGPAHDLPITDAFIDAANQLDPQP